MKKTIFLVKFDCGYYAAKQPNYDWSFTNDPLLANRYKTRKPAEKLAKHGLALGAQWRSYGAKLQSNKIVASSVEIEECELEEVITVLSTGKV